ncbi:MAG: hypothetical protein ACN4GZ_16135, partial [Acidimicrobiales bacterium]
AHHVDRKDLELQVTSLDGYCALRTTSIDTKRPAIVGQQLTHAEGRTVSEDKPAEDGTLAHHMEHLAATADDVVDMLSRPHEAGEIHPEALAHAAHLQTSLRDVIHALLHHDHLAIKSDDVWKALTVKHRGSTEEIS